jgi:hypothetical protein
MELITPIKGLTVQVQRQIKEPTKEKKIENYISRGSTTKQSRFEIKETLVASG